MKNIFLKSALFIIFCAAFFAFGCSSKYKTKKTLPDLGKKHYEYKVTSIGSKIFVLSKDAGQTDMRKFQSHADSCYQKIMSAGKNLKFAYSISPAGVVNPMSSVEVSCLAQDSSAKTLCDRFLNLISEKYK